MATLAKGLIASLLALAVNGASTRAAGVDGAADETPSRWFVELASPPAADGGRVATLRAEKDAFRREARGVLQLRERLAFDTLFNGLSVEVPRSQVGRLARVPGVKALHPVETYRIPETTPSVPDLLTALSMTGADVTQSELGFTGRGVRVAVMDTGLDYDHAAFGGDGVTRSNSPFFAGAGGTNPASRVVAGFDFVGDAYNADLGTAPVPDPFPDDCNGHGTHVAGIVGASRGPGPFEPGGVAPGVVYGAYRVFGCDGSTDADIMVAAMERALADGMDVLNMSIGSAFQWPQYPTAQAASRLVNLGMVVVASIGNSGANGLWSLGAPGVGEHVIGVASLDNVQNVLPTFTIPQPTAEDPGAVRVIGYDAAAGLAQGVQIPKAGTFEMARTGTTTTANDACSPLTPGSLAGKVALVRRGTCTFYAKAKNAENAGAVGVVLYNNAAGRLSPTVAPPTPADPTVGVPVVMVTAVDGAAIDAAIAAGGVSMTWTDEVAAFPNATVGLASSFTSYGLSPDLALKPDLAAPGGFIWSTFPLELGGYANLSGTSMSSPHVAGAVALLLEARPRTPTKLVRSLLQNSAVPALWFGAPALGFLDNVGRQGAGLLHVDRAIQATALVEPAKLALGESQAGPQTRTLTIRNGAAAPVTYALSHEAGLAVDRTFAPRFFDAFAAVSFSQPALAVPAGGAGTVDVTVTAPAAPDRGQYGGWIVLTPQDGGDALRVPYAGFVGDYQSIQVLVPTANGFPWLARLVGDDFVNQPAGATFTLADGDVPFFLLHLDHQSQKLRASVRDVRTGRSWHDAFREEFLPRNATATGFFSFPWDGVTSAGRRIYTVPDGTYVVTFQILKALGDESDPAHWETWSSPPVTIDRP